MSGIFDKFSGSLTADVLSFNPDAIPAPDTLVIRMTRGERRIADELRKQFGRVRRVTIDVDGERHEFSADSLIRLLEGCEGARDTSRYAELFGTPERAARTICRQLKHYNICICDGCPVKPPNKECDSEYDALLEWLEGETE